MLLAPDMGRHTWSPWVACAAAAATACGSAATSESHATGSAPDDAGGETDLDAATSGDAVTFDPSLVLEAAAPDAPDGAATCGFTPCAPGQPCPDLIVEQNDLMASTVVDTRTFAPTDCAIVEGCITTPGTRRLLRFDTATGNVGNADLVIGSPSTLGQACFEWSPCHMHNHFKGFARYTLYQSDGVTIAATGHKQSFCLDDGETIPWFDPQPPEPAERFQCWNQGLHIGWEDVYPNDIDCQWIDITGVPAGDYILSVIVNATHALPESDYTNNEARVPVTIAAP